MATTIYEELFSLAGKTAMITGGYRGIGRMFAETYAEAGADVALVARRGDACRDAALEISRQYGVRTIAIPMDVRDSERVGAVVDEVVSEFGRLDILVNNVGVSGTQKPVIELTDWGK